MERNVEIRLSLVVWISLFLHIVFFTGFLLRQTDPRSQFFSRQPRQFAGQGGLPARDIIVNVNQDDKQVVTNTTLLSDRDSSAQGYVSKKLGDRWLNNSLEFKLKRGSSGDGRTLSSSNADNSRYLLSKGGEITVSILKSPAGETDISGKGGNADFSAIPDRNNISRENAIYYSNTNRFSFNTKKFKNFEYFRRMKDKIASNWFPPMVANSVFGGYAPGAVRIMAIPSQEVKLYFVMNRKGDVLNVRIIESLGNVSLDSSCLDAIRLSKNFGKVPEDITGEMIVIPFIFGYYVQ